MILLILILHLKYHNIFWIILLEQRSVKNNMFGISKTELDSEIDRIKENIDKMCFINTLSELEQAYELAKIILEVIYVCNRNRLYAEEERNDDWDYE